MRWTRAFRSVALFGLAAVVVVATNGRGDVCDGTTPGPYGYCPPPDENGLWDPSGGAVPGVDANCRKYNGNGGDCGTKYEWAAKKLNSDCKGPKSTNPPNTRCTYAGKEIMGKWVPLLTECGKKWQCKYNDETKICQFDGNDMSDPLKTVYTVNEKCETTPAGPP